MNQSIQSVNDPLIDAKNIKQSISAPKDMNKLINIVAYRSNEQRQLIKDSYLQNFKCNIQDELKSELSGNFQKAVVALFYTPVDYDCYQLYKAMKGFGTDEDVLIEIIATRSNKRIAEIKDRYPQFSQGKELKAHIASETSGFLKKILLELLEGKRSDNRHPDQQACEEEAVKLQEAEKNKEIREDVYKNIFTQKSKEEFTLIATSYYKKTNQTLLQSIEHLFSGDSKRILTAIAYALLSPSEFFSDRIHKAIKSFLTKDNTLIRVLVSRDEVDIERIKKYYKQKYKEDLYTTVNNEIKGDYGSLLRALIRK